MKNRISEKDVLQVLNSLKSSEGNYPQEMIESRRSAFTKQAAAMAVLMEAGINGANASGASQTASTASTAASGSTTTGIGAASMGKVLEIALVIAIIAEAGVAAYVYREKIAAFYNSIFGSKVEQTTSPTNNSTDFNTNNGSGTDPLAATPTVTLTETPFPPGYTPPAQAENNNRDSQTASTPAPTDDSNGLHLGQTKQPTKDPNKSDNNKNK